MEIKLVTGESIFQACVNTIKQIDVSKSDEYNLLVVPDTFSMQAESLLFDTLNLKTVFNVEVVGISKLASYILRSENIPYQRVSGIEETFNIYRAVKWAEKDFQYFGQCDVDLCVKLLQIIKQFKGCKIYPENIKKVGDEVLDRKMHDLKIVYEKYEELLGEKLDLSKLLEFCSENAEKSLKLSKINLFFANFDSFSLEIHEFICKLATLVGRVVIGVSRPISQNNAFIFEDDIMKKVTAIAKEKSLVVENENFPTSLDERRLKIVKNLFGFDVQEGVYDDYFLNVLAKNKQDEAEFVAKYIKSCVFKGKEYKNFAVAVSDEGYYEKIKEAFEKCGISFYSDEATDLTNTILCRFLLKLIDISLLGFNKERLQYVVSSPLVESENKEQILKDISYLNIENSEEFLERFPEFEKIVSLTESLCKGQKINDFILTIKQIVELCSEQYDELIQSLSAERFFKEESQNSQARDLILQVMEKLISLGGEEKMSLPDFKNLFTLALQSVKVETVPTYIDAVYLGDVSKSYFEDVDTLFVLGATSNALPNTRSDTGIIDDNDIEKLRLNFLIEPTIKVLNRRSRLKLFECLLHAKERLVVCYPAVEDGRQSQIPNFVKDLRKIFGENILHTESFENINLPQLSEEQKIENLMFNLWCKGNLPTAYAMMKSKNCLPIRFEGAVKNILENEIFEQKRVECLPEETKGLLLKNGKVSASQLETYFKCPFKHFVSYGLGIKENENIEPNKRLFGVFIHAVLQKFVEEFGEVGKLKIDDVDVFLRKNVNEISKNVYHEKILQRKHFLDYLRGEARIVLKNTVYEQSVSSFRPKLLERRIDDRFANGTRLVGYVDRTDVFDKYFRIIDYKTGKTQSIKKDLFYGRKLQLFLYASSMKKRLSLECGGVYYFDCQTKYSKGQTGVRFNGLTLADDEVVYATDKRLEVSDEKSDIVGFSRKKSAKEGEFSFKGGNPTANFEDLFDYAVEVSQNAIDELREGFVLDKPFKGECENCPYKSVCGHRDSDGYRMMQSVSDEFLKGKDDDN